MPLVVRWLRLPGIFSLYLVVAIAFLLLAQSSGSAPRENRKAEKQKESAVRARARSSPDFTTFCYQCLFSRQAGARCQLKIDGEEVREITIGPRTYCTSFRQGPAGNLQAGS